MIEKNHKIISHGSVYLFGNILRYAISFVMLPIYTRLLTPADYGIIELLSMVIDFSGIIFGMRVGEAIFRFYLDYEDRKKKNQVISTAMILTIILSIFGFILITISSGMLSNLIFGSENYRILLCIFSLTLLFSPFTEIPMTFIRAQQRPWLFVCISALKMFIALSLNIYFVVLKKMGVPGVVYSAVISSGFMAILLSLYSFYQTGGKFSLKTAKILISFSYPLVLTGIISYYITFGDRYFLNYYGTLSDVGLYSLGYKFGFLLSFIGTGPFSSIWESERYRLLKRNDAKDIFQQVFNFYSAYTIIIVVLIAIFSKYVLMIMANPEFWEASKIVPIILFAYFFQGWTGYCNLGIMIEKKTFIITKSVLLAAFVITILYYFLIPEFGAMGAATSTLIAFVTRFLYIHWNSVKLYNMHLKWGKVLMLFPPCIIVITISAYGPNSMLLSLLLNIALSVILIYSFTIIPFFPTKQRYKLRKLFFKPWMLPKTLYSIIRSA